MPIIVFVYLARVLVRHAAVVVVAVAFAVAAVTSALLPLVVTRVFTTPTTIVDINTIGLVAIALRHRHDAACRVRVVCACRDVQ